MELQHQVLKETSSLLPPKRRAVRCLFGKPEPGQNETWLCDKLKEIQDQQRTKYGFDFSTDTPTTSANSEYKWSAVPSSDLPAFYSERTVSDRLAPPSTENAENEARMDIDSVQKRDSSEATPGKKFNERRLTQSAGVSKRTALSAYFRKKKRSSSWLLQHKVDELSSSRRVPSSPVGSPVKKPRL